MEIQKWLALTATIVLLSGCANDSSSATDPQKKFGPTAPPTSSAENCAEELILAAAKTNVANVYGNRPESGGDCALGVRQSLQLSQVGGITGGIGNAIDYVANLPPYGFVATGLTDPNTAIPGSVIVFAGPNSASYLSTGKYGSPPGDWLGHVTIKGDDGYYYTDARTVEPAIGWENGVNVVGERTVAGIFIPDAALASEYAGKCATLPPVATSVPIPTSPAVLDGHRRMPAAVREMQAFTQMAATDPGRTAAFQQMLVLAREILPYDSEGQLTHLMATALLADSSLQTQYDEYVQAVSNHDAATCNTQRLTTAMVEAKCMLNAGLTGQDFVGAGHSNDGNLCISKFNYESCLSSIH